VPDRRIEPLVPGIPAVAVLDNRDVPGDVLHLPAQIAFVKDVNP